MQYMQCLMQRKTSIRTLEVVAWIPEKFAVVGKILELTSKSKVKTNGWEVVSVGDPQDEKYVLSHERDYLLTRKASDI